MHMATAARTIGRAGTTAAAAAAAAATTTTPTAAAAAAATTTREAVCNISKVLPLQIPCDPPYAQEGGRGGRGGPGGRQPPRNLKFNLNAPGWGWGCVGG